MHLTDVTEAEVLIAEKLIKNGICFVAYDQGGQLRFAPSRFVGYQKNKLDKHKKSHLNGRETNNAISNYLSYCTSLGIHPGYKGKFGVTRKYWKINVENHQIEENEIASSFPEGSIVERTHLSRERNSKVISIAKDVFKRQDGKLFCQVCGFDFEETYGDLGKDFIEGHHTIPISEMQPGQPTKVEDIALVCANCHRMLHKRRHWLLFSEIQNALKAKTR